ncbi:hypothetical protein BDC45DRAFT_556741 [Circinella umbellata]|nr:hypothetical protein BDC45DRAFT_556741 [Circinella umbellata]
MPNLIDPQYWDNNQHTSGSNEEDECNLILRCYPGSVFEGHLELYSTEPFLVKGLKLTLRGSELINYGAMSKYRNGDKGVIFSVRARLPSSSSSIWLNPGTIYRFPFVCQFPMVNFPPTFQHPLLESKYTLLATVNDIYKSKPFSVDFEPCVETSPYAKIQMYNYTRDRIRFSLVTGLYYQLQKDTLIRMRIDKLSLSSSSSSTDSSSSLSSSSTMSSLLSFSTVSIALKQILTIGYRNQPDPHKESITLSSIDIGSSNQQQQQEDAHVVVELPIPIDLVRLPTLTTMSSFRFQIAYKIIVSNKIRCGPIVIQRKLFEVPITIGTLPHGTTVSPDLLSYADEHVAQDMTTRAKPRLVISSIQRDDNDVLPAYDDTRPPIYYPQIPI